MAKSTSKSKGGTASSKNNAASKGAARLSSPPSSAKGEILTNVFLVLAVIVALSFNFLRSAVTDLGLFLGEVQSLNTQGCQAVQGLEACEDIHIHHPSGLAFTGCGHAEARKSWFPPLDKNNVSTTATAAFKDQFVIYNIQSGEYKEMELAGFPADADRLYHGIGVHERSATELTIFVVNHRRTGSVIEVLEYTIGDPVVQYKETIQHNLIVTPNDIVALGPRSFYVSNDHHYKTGFWRHVEEYLRRPWSNVIYYSPEKTFVAFEGVKSANGMTSNTDQSLVFLSGCHGSGLHVLVPQMDHSLTQQNYLKFDFYNDNPSVDPLTGDVFLAGHVQPLKLMQGVSIPNVPVVGPSKVIKLHKNAQAESIPGSNAYVVETVLTDDGHLISTATVAAVDRARGVMLIGTAVAEKGLWRCPIPEFV